MFFRHVTLSPDFFLFNLLISYLRLLSVAHLITYSFYEFWRCISYNISWYEFCIWYCRSLISGYHHILMVILNKMQSTHFALVLLPVIHLSMPQVSVRRHFLFSIFILSNCTCMHNTMSSDIALSLSSPYIFELNLNLQLVLL